MVPAGGELAFDELDALVGGALAVVVLDDVVEPPGEAPLLGGERDPLVDLAGALGRPLAQPALELVERRVDEDRERAAGSAP